MSPRLAPVLRLLPAFLVAGCAMLRPPEPERAPGPPRAIQLLAQVPERETTKLSEQRFDVEIDTHDWDRTPRVVASGETPELRLEDARARLFGDAAGKAGWTVDNVLLLEVLNARGEVIQRAVVGSSDPVMIGREHVDNIGPRSFTFEPGEVDITPTLPEREPFKLRATVLDYYGVGRVSDVYVVLDHGARRSGSDDDLRGQ